MSNYHGNHHHHHKKGLFSGLTDKQQGIVIGAGVATAVATPITVFTTRRAMKAEWLENRERLIAAQKNQK